MPKKKTKKVEIAAMRSEFHSGNQSMAAPSAPAERGSGRGLHSMEWTNGKRSPLPVAGFFVYAAAEKPTASKIAVASGVRQKSRNACAVSAFCEMFRTAAG